MIYEPIKFGIFENFLPLFYASAISKCHSASATARRPGHVIYLESDVVLLAYIILIFAGMVFAFFEENRAGVSPLLNGFIIKTHFTRQCSTLHESFPRKNSHFCELNFEFDIFFWLYEFFMAPRNANS